MEIKDKKHLEEFKEIISRVPDRYSSVVIYGLLLFLCIVICLTLIVNVPDKVTAEIRITSTNPPIILKAHSTGRVKLLIDSLPKYCQEGQYIAMIDNPANAREVVFLKDELSKITIPFNKKEILPQWDSDTNMDFGEIEPYYFRFVEQSHNLKTLLEENKYTFQIQLLQEQIKNDSIHLVISQEIRANYELSYDINYRQFQKDSLLYIHKAILEKEYDNSRISILNLQRSLASTESDIQRLKKSILEAQLNKASVENEFYNLLKENERKYIEAYQNLLTSIKTWERMYVFTTPESGYVEFANLITNDTFITVGEPTFNIIYDETAYIGIAVLPATGAGKVKTGQKVNIKTDLFPYQEFGYLEGYISSISMNAVDKNYLVYIDLPNGVVSSSGTELIFAETMYGQAEIITEKKKLISKIFYQLHKILTSDKTATSSEDNPNETRSYQF